MATGARWAKLGVGRAELALEHTLPTGQSFRWRQPRPGVYVGVLGKRVLALKPDGEGDVLWRDLTAAGGGSADAAADDLRDFFNLATPLAPLYADFAGKDARFAAVAPHLPGARVLRQHPVETLFSFICSSNNHISRIQGMVEHLCKEYGDPIAVVPAAEAVDADGSLVGEDAAFYTFPTVDQLGTATEEALRAGGFGYRAKFIVGAAAKLAERDGGAERYLLGLRDAPYADAVAALVELPGIGPKVAACICLFALDKHEAIPVDTHVWQIAIAHYTPHLKGKTLTPKIMQAVEQVFIDRFGPYAGWAHNTLFVGDLRSMQEHLPEHLRSPAEKKPRKAKKEKKADAGGEDGEEDASEGEQQGGEEEAAAAAAAAARPKKKKAKKALEGELETKG